MNKLILSCCMLGLLTFKVLSQTSQLQYSISLEAYGFQYYWINNTHLEYAGQTAMFRLSKPLGKSWEAGITAGAYVHYRESRLAPNVYVYAPIQGHILYHTPNNRFGAEFSTGFPFKIHEYKPFVFAKGFWYKDVYSPDETPEQLFQKNEIYKRTSIKVVSNLRLRFRLHPDNHWFLTTGVRMMIYKLGTKEVGLGGREFNLPGNEHYYNISLGLEYKF